MHADDQAGVGGHGARDDGDVGVLVLPFRILSSASFRPCHFLGVRA